MSERITDKNTFFYKKIRYDALAGELRFSTLKDKTRTDYQDEVSRLEKELDSPVAKKKILFELNSLL